MNQQVVFVWFLLVFQGFGGSLGFWFVSHLPRCFLKKIADILKGTTKQENLDIPIYGTPSWTHPDAGKDREGEEEGDRGWDGWMASSTQWTWVWVNSRKRWRTGKPAVLPSMGSQSRARVSHWTATIWYQHQNWGSVLLTIWILTSLNLLHLQVNSSICSADTENSL